MPVPLRFSVHVSRLRISASIARKCAEQVPAPTEPETGTPCEEARDVRAPQLLIL